MNSYEFERAMWKAVGPQTLPAIQTHVPSKWRFVDLETGQVWGVDMENGQRTYKLVDELVRHEDGTVQFDPRETPQASADPDGHYGV